MDQNARVMIEQARTAYRRTFTQGLIVAALAVWLGVISLQSDTLIIAIPMFMGAGAAICSCFTRVAMTIMVHRGRMWQHNLHIYYTEAVQKLYAVYGHDPADILKEMPEQPFPNGDRT